jgi:hypothetical protein
MTLYQITEKTSGMSRVYPTLEGLLEAKALIEGSNWGALGYQFSYEQGNTEILDPYGAVLFEPFAP